MSKLAINGGKKVRNTLFPAQITIGDEEKEAVFRVLDTGRLSYYRGNNTESFWGGPEIQRTERLIEKNIDVKHAMLVNSCTSALFIACGAIGLKSGDEVIVTPWSMSCSATVPLWYGAIPVFADIEEDYYCLDPESIKSKITNKTKAIIAVSLFGQPYSEEIDKIAEEYGLYVIEDAAQSLGSKRGNRYSGSLGHIGCYSFTQGKLLTSGEGGAIVTDSDELAARSAYIRNHGESVINDMSDMNPHYDTSVIGLNFRMTEIEAAIIYEQFIKLDSFVEIRNHNARTLNELFKLHLPGIIESSKIRSNSTHSYYALAYKYKGDIQRNTFLEAVRAELSEEEGRIDKGVAIGGGYIKPLYRFPIFDYKYKLPIVEKLWENELFVTTIHGLPLTEKDMYDIVNAFKKVYENRGELSD